MFLGLSPHGTHGYIQFPNELFVISTRAGNTVIYSLTALPEGLLTFPDFECDVIEVVNRIGADNPTPSGASAPCRVVDIAIETDWEFTQYRFIQLLELTSTRARQFFEGPLVQIFKQQTDCLVKGS